MILHRRVLAFSAGVEAAMGMALIAVPVLVIRMLLAADLPGTGPLVARFFGVALVALALAVWPGGSGATRQAVRAMLVYNILLAIALVWIALAEHLVGPLLWPAVVFHVAVAALLARPLRDDS